MIDKIIKTFFVKVNAKNNKEIENNRLQNQNSEDLIFKELKLKRETKFQSEKFENLFPNFNKLKGLNVKERLFYNQ